MNGLSIIMPLWGKTHLDNAKAVIESLILSDAPDNCELIIAMPQGEVWPLCPVQHNMRTVWFRASGQWHLSTARNEGAKHAMFETLCFHDCDALIWPGWAQAVIEQSSKRGYCGTYNAIGYLNQDRSMQARSDAAEWQQPKLDDIYLAPVAGGGCGLSFAISKAAFERVGPWREYPGWGGEDVQYRNRLSQSEGISPHDLKKICLPRPLYHLWHEESDKSHQPQNMKDARGGKR